MVLTSNLSGAYENPITLNAKGSDKTIDKSDQSLAIPNVEKELKRVVEMEPKDDKNGRESTTGSPKPSNRHGDGGPVRGNKRTHLATKGVQRDNTETLLSGTVSTEIVCREVVSALDKLRKESEVRDIYRLMCSEELFIAAYHRIKSKVGNMTPGTDKETLDGISMDKIRRIIMELRYLKFQFRPVRITYIPKPNGKTRPLGIPSPMDKLVQEVMKIILEAIYEPIFKDSSHGFRPGRSCHTALKYVSQ